MFAVDTSSLVAFFHDEAGRDVEAVAVALEESCAVFSPVVLTELLSDHKLSREVVSLVKSLPILEIKAGYWERAGLLRAKILKKGLKAKLADTLIAQNCIDHGLALITRDEDFRAYAKYAELRLVVGS